MPQFGLALLTVILVAACICVQVLVDIARDIRGIRRLVDMIACRQIDERRGGER